MGTNPYFTCQTDWPPQTTRIRNSQTQYQKDRHAELKQRAGIETARRLEELKMRRAETVAGKAAQIEQESRAQRDCLLNHISLITKPVEEGGVGLPSLGAAIDALSDIEGGDAQLTHTEEQGSKNQDENTGE